MKNDSKIAAIIIVLFMASVITLGCYKEYIDLKAKVAIIKMSNK